MASLAPRLATNTMEIALFLLEVKSRNVSLVIIAGRMNNARGNQSAFAPPPPSLEICLQI